MRNAPATEEAYGGRGHRNPDYFGFSGEKTMNSNSSIPPPPQDNTDPCLRRSFTHNTPGTALNPQKGGNKAVKKTRCAPVRLLAAAGAIALCLAACENAVEPEIRYIAGEMVVIESGIKIETAEQLAGIGLTDEYPADGEYYLANDIDLSVLWEEDPEDPPLTPYVWRPIGSTCRECGGPLHPTPENSIRITHALPLKCENTHCPLYLENTPQQPFSGALHGNGYTVSGLKLPIGTEENGYKDAIYLGLFGYTSSAYIHDLTIKVANTADGRTGFESPPDSVRPGIGALAGVDSGSRIENVHIEAENNNAGLYITAKSTGAYYVYAGGVIGLGINTTLKDVTSSARLDLIGKNYTMAGGIAGGISTLNISNMTATDSITGAKVTGDIIVNDTGAYVVVAGICPLARLIQDCVVDINELSCAVNLATNTQRAVAVSGIGYGAITDCDVDIGLIKLSVSDENSSTTNYRDVYVGGISAYTVPLAGMTSAAASTNQIMERNKVRFGKIDVTSGETAVIRYFYMGGVTGGISVASNSTAKVIDCSVDGGEIAVNLAGSLVTNPFNVGGIAGQGHVSNSSVNGSLKINVTTNSATATPFFVGGIAGNGNVSDSGISGTLESKVITKTTTAIVYAGGLAGSGSVSNGRIGKLDMNIKTFQTTAAAALYAGGLTGVGNILRGSVTDSDINVETTTIGPVNVGGLTGQGTAEHSFTGTKDKHAKVNVSKGTISTSLTANNLAYIGGISGRAVLTTAATFQYNYAFCDLTLETTAATSGATGQSVGGLVGYPSGNFTFAENFAVGTVSVIDNCNTIASTIQTRFNVGGVAGYMASGPYITKCASLGGPVTITGNGSGSLSAKYWRGIVWSAAGSNTVINNNPSNITTVTDSPPAHYNPYNAVANSQDGLLLTTLTEDTFLGTADAAVGSLGWNQDVWRWDTASGYPAFK
jgi:hypothetical protein